MTIQFNSDKTIDGGERQSTYFSGIIEEELDRFRDYITRVEVHLSSETGGKEGIRDIKCLLEARLKGRSPIAITNHGNTEEQAISGAADKLKSSLETILGRLHDH